MLFLITFTGVSPYLKGKLFLNEVSRACRIHSKASKCVFELGFLSLAASVF